MYTPVTPRIPKRLRRAATVQGENSAVRSLCVSDCSSSAYNPRPSDALPASAQTPVLLPKGHSIDPPQLVRLRRFVDGGTNSGHVLQSHGSGVLLELLHVFQCRLGLQLVQAECYPHPLKGSWKPQPILTCRTKHAKGILDDSTSRIPRRRLCEAVHYRFDGEAAAKLNASPRSQFLNLHTLLRRHSARGRYLRKTCPAPR